MKFVFYIRKIFFKFLPVKKSRFFFTSFNGHYSDSPKRLSEEIHQLDNSIEIIWGLEKQRFEEVPNYVKKVAIDSPQADYYYHTSHFLIDNSFGNKLTMQIFPGKKEKLKFRIKKFLTNKKKQFVFTTWHGTPLKKMGRDQIGFNVIEFDCPNTEMMLGNEYTLNIMNHISFEKIKMTLMGTPRNDILFNIDNKKIKKIKQELGLPENKKILLFAPTFRSDSNDGENKNILRSGINQLNEFNIAELLSNLSSKFSGDWVIVCRFHYFVEKMVDWKALDVQSEGKIINGNDYDDMSKYLACSDILMTDASSSMFDFAITKRPCFLYFPDVEFYKNEERGFYVPIEKLPFPLVTTFEELMNSVQKFDHAAYVSEVEKLLVDFNYVDEKEATTKMAKYILSKK